MIEFKPSDQGFKGPAQREVLSGLSRNEDISNYFFLTGGTALSAFYLAHRVSEDLDLFSKEKADLADGISGMRSPTLRNGSTTREGE